MHVLLVSIHVRPETTHEFVAATLENVRETLKEQGVWRFDLLRQVDQPHHFMLFEVYEKAEDHARHRDTPHSKRWNEAAKQMMTEPPTRTIYESVYPRESGWDSTPTTP